MSVAYLTLFFTNVSSGLLGSLYEWMGPVNFWIGNTAISLCGALVAFVIGPAITRALAPMPSHPSLARGAHMKRQSQPGGPDMMTGTVALITGASSGIGDATALLFAERGVSVVLAARPGDELGDAVAAIERAGGSASAVRADVSSGSPSDGVAPLARATSPRCATFLAEELPEAITVDQIYRAPLWRSEPIHDQPRALHPRPWPAPAAARLGLCAGDQCREHYRIGDHAHPGACR